MECLQIRSSADVMSKATCLSIQSFRSDDRGFPLSGHSGGIPEVPAADHGEGRGSHQAGGEAGQGGVSGDAGNRWVGVQEFYKLLKEFPAAKAYVTFSCKGGKNLCHGEEFSDAIQKVMTSDQVIAAGLNCTHPSHVSELLDSIRPLQPTKPIIVKPNSGEDWKSGEGWFGRGENSPLENHVTDWIKKGATWIGGCCRIKPRDIKSLEERIRNID